MKATAFQLQRMADPSLQYLHLLSFVQHQFYTYRDNVELRQAIERQLNVVELTHRFSKAVFFGDNQEFRVETKEEQEVVTGCKPHPERHCTPRILGSPL